MFVSKLKEEVARKKLQAALTKKLGKDVGVTLRTARELQATLQHNPFPKAPPNHVIVVFVNEKLPKSTLDNVSAPGGEELKLAGRELYVYYPAGVGVSKLKLPVAKTGTGRNLNTVAKLADMARAAAG